ncbi:hypothetical protein DRH13_06365, partial [Candidatus Woesebacteria bacterium]
TQKCLFWDQINFKSELMRLWRKQRDFLDSKVKDIRERKGLTQIRAAKLIKSSQSRLSKIESADTSVSIYLQIRSLLALGASKVEIGQKIEC